MDNVRKNQYTGFNSYITKYTRKLRKNMTKQERHLWYDFLRKYPIKVYRQRSIDCYIVDFYCSQANLVIEIDGGIIPKKVQHMIRSAQQLLKNIT